MQLGSVFQAQGYYFSPHFMIGYPQINGIVFICTPLDPLSNSKVSKWKKVTFCLCVLWWDSLLYFLTYFSWNLLQFREEIVLRIFFQMKNKIVSFLIKLITLFLTITSVITPLGRAQRQNITHFFVERIEVEVGKKLSKWLQCMMMLNGRRSTGVKKMIIMMACSSSIRLEGESQNNGCMFSQTLF